MRNGSRLFAALAALSMNVLLFSVVTLIGRASAEPSTNPPASQTPAPVPTQDDDSPFKVAKPDSEAPKRPAKKSIVRKVLPVRDFGGY